MTVKATPDVAVETSQLAGTTIYGKLLQVGGEPPIAIIDVAGTGHLIECTFDKSLARQLGKRIYTWVGLNGTATVEDVNLKVVAFAIEAMTPYKGTPVDEAFAKLSEIADPYYKDIDDVEAYVDSLRLDD